MSANQRFVLDENRYVLDRLNPGSPKGYCFEDDQVHLRESVLLVRLRKMVDDLIINLKPEQRYAWGEQYQPFNEESHAIQYAIWDAIRASRLNTIDISVSIQNRFDGIPKHQKEGLLEFTSLWLFRDDVEHLLRDLYGDIESEALDHILRAVFTIVKEFAHYLRKDLWQEYQDAYRADYIYGIGVPEGNGISSSDWRFGMAALSDLRILAREVRENPAAFSKYTVEFVHEFLKQFWPNESDGESVSLTPG